MIFIAFFSFSKYRAGGDQVLSKSISIVPRKLVKYTKKKLVSLSKQDAFRLLAAAAGSNRKSVHFFIVNQSKITSKINTTLSDNLSSTEYENLFALLNILVEGYVAWQHISSVLISFGSKEMMSQKSWAVMGFPSAPTL